MPLEFQQLDFIIQCQVQQLPPIIWNKLQDTLSLKLTKQQSDYLFSNNNKLNVYRQSSGMPRVIQNLKHSHPGRAQQINIIYQFIKNHLKNGAQSPLSIHGNTGCGKTQIVNEIISYFEQNQPNLSCIYINCMNLWSCNKIYSCFNNSLFNKLLKKPYLQSLNEVFNGKSLIKQLQHHITKTKLIILDQVDQFIKDKSFMYNILQWINLPHSKIILIVITNILDLGVQLEQKVRSRMKHQCLIFKPYSYKQIYQIFNTKHPEWTLNFQQSAVSYMCRKVANINSDIRLLQSIFDQLMIKKQSNNKINIQQVKEYFVKNNQIARILKPFNTIIKILSRATQSTDLYYQMKQGYYLQGLEKPTVNEILSMLKDLKQFGFIQIETITNKKDNLTFNGFSIKIKEQLKYYADDQCNF